MASAEEDSDEIYIDETDFGDVDADDFLDFDWDDFYDELEGLDDAEDEDYG